MKDMHATYYGMKTPQLRKLRSEKYLRLLKLERHKMGYFDQQEARKLRQQIIWIDAVLEARALQMELE